MSLKSPGGEGEVFHQELRSEAMFAAVYMKPAGLKTSGRDYMLLNKMAVIVAVAVVCNLKFSLWAALLILFFVVVLRNCLSSLFL